MEWFLDAASKHGTKWFYAISVNDGEWEVKAVSKNLISFDETEAFDCVPLEVIKRSQIAIFRHGASWENRSPRYYRDLRDKIHKPVPAAIGMWLVNQADAGYF